MISNDTTPTLLGGISSSFRTNPYTGGHIEVRRARGATLELTDGRELIDTFMAHGSTVLGHGEPAVMQAVQHELEAGVLLGYETGLAAAVADRLARILPAAERIRFCSTGTEAVATALRMCRAFTGREIVIKIDGHYNGSSDYAMVNSTAAAIDRDNPGGRPSQRIRSCSGIPEPSADSIVPVPWNDAEALETALSMYEERVAAVLMVPLDLNNGCIRPADGYLNTARRLTAAHGVLLVFDEVLSGFKTGLSGATGTFGGDPDVTVWSKAVASSFPLSVVAGREDVMAMMALPLPQGTLQGGTHAGNIPGLAAAQATLDVLEEPAFYETLTERTREFAAALESRMRAAGMTARVQSAGCGYGIYVGTDEPIRSCADVRRHVDQQMAKRLFTACLEEGVYFHTDLTVSIAHTDEVLGEIVSRVGRAADRVVDGAALTGARELSR
ncbi:MAG TPA: aminotransferase class III-fold pyridoxal phosphate-dependent enzyme [Solirubrobacteraceae bacterium]|nr:aminotransferase class III-fold pyridoxal phosphate-dependent enzyme [Solirubrobacteraceae bacterium]